MNLKTTLALLILVAAGGTILWFGPSLPWAQPAAHPDAGTRAALEELSPARLTRIEVSAGGHLTRLERAPGGAWSLPGKWPTRTAEVNALVELLGGLRTRFEPIPIRGDTDLARFGLDKPAATVKLETEDRKVTFTLGEEPAEVVQNRFSRPTYLRLGDKPEVVRLGPGIVDVLDRPTDYYQQRRLFPGERVAREDNPQEKTERLAARSLEAEEKKEGGVHFRLAHQGDAWELSYPTRDRLDPRARDALLAAVPDLWAERFVGPDVVDAAKVVGTPDAGLPSALTSLMWTDTLLKKIGLDKPEYVLTVTRNDGEAVMLLVGKVSGTRSRKVTRPPPPGMPPGMGAMEQEVKEEFRYAMLQGNAQVFEIKADKLKDVFVKPDTLRDPQVARFKPADARRLELTHDGQEIVFIKDKERWKLDKPLQADADREKVNDLLFKLSSLEARDKDILDNADLKTYGLDKPATVVKVTVEEEAKGEGDTRTKKSRTLTLKLGKDDKEAKKLYVQTDDWPRVNAVEDSLAPLVARPALAYRGKRVLDFTAADLAKIEIRRGDKAGYALQQDNGRWKLNAAPGAEADADTPTVSQLADRLSNLEALEYVSNAPKAEELEPQYGLGKPALVVRLQFADKAKAPQTLHVGKARGAKPGYFARVANGLEPSAVFAVNNDVFTALDRDALAFLPHELWRVLPEEVAALKVRKEEQPEYRLARADKGWRVEGPFSAPALAGAADALVQELAAPVCESFKALEAKNLTEYGLDKPYLTLALAAKDGKEHTLLVGAPTEKGSLSRFAKVSDRPAVFVVNDLFLSSTDRAALDLLDPVLLKLDPAKIERVQSKAGGEALTIERKGEEWKVTEGPGTPFAADAGAMATETSVWAVLRADRFAAYGDKLDAAKYGLDKPEITVTVSARDGEKETSHVVELGKPAAEVPGGRYARVGNVPGVAVLAPSVASVLARTHLDFVNRTMLKLDPASVTAVQRQMGSDTLELTRNDDGWRLTRPVDDKADDRAVGDLVSQLAGLRARRVAEYPAKDLKAFGLDAPQTVVTLKPGGQVLKIGKAADEAGGDPFALVEGNPAVFVLPGAMAKRLVGAPLAFRDRAVARFADADKVVLERGPRKAVFARVDGSWKLTEPLTAPAEQDDLDEFVNTLAKLRADELVAEKPGPDELKRYGLDRPEVRYRLQAGEQDVLNLLVGDREKDGPRVYAKLAGRDLVFLLDPKLSARALGEFRPRAVWPVPLDAVQIQSLRYEYAKNPFTLEKSELGAWQVAGKPDLKPNPEAVNETLAALANLKLVRYAMDRGADPKLFGLDPPELVLEVATRTGKRTLQIGAVVGGTKQRYARVPDPDRSDVFVLEEADVAKIMRDAAAFTKAPVTRPLP
jgi:hypothetical protein